MWQGILSKVFKVRDKVALNLSKEDEEKPFLDHLDDLRTMLVRMGITLISATIISFYFYKELFNAILYPMVLAGFAPNIEEARKLLINIDVAGPFMMAVNVSLIAAVIASFPLLLVFLLQFILPGLKSNEKKLLFPAIAIGTGLFLSGAAFSYWVVLPRALVFFSEFAASVGATQTWTIDNYVTFTTRFILVFGIAFELPIIVMALVKLDFLNFRIMKSTWRHAIIAITLFAAVVTPTPDVLTLMLMSGPLYVLYAVCVILAYFMEKKDRAAYPEYYAELEKDQKELEQESGDEWDNENYNPWFSDEKDDEDDEYQKPRAVPSAPPPQVEKAPKTVSMEDPVDEGEDQGSVMPEEEENQPEVEATEASPASPEPTPEKPQTEKSTEELAREDESRSGNPPV
ncbi:twin arginine targeting (Tat) protein translocase TatC [Prosthecobacter debontii]|uniref:Sec-independent protein translocase protein TatC n=1 Tax=Prosthecobacter debontii TaxID=48467 RepID=A0A1T4YVU3_9BACT|nr:twin-arginine translocase subunit TatC [Prosthecobacter debontii]SKB05421.1 twin arginine targeting (Tat) protein translocase TatC [Prosthecobacter debontii]